MATSKVITAAPTIELSLSIEEAGWLAAMAQNFLGKAPEDECLEASRLRLEIFNAVTQGIEESQEVSDYD